MRQGEIELIWMNDEEEEITCVFPSKNEVCSDCGGEGYVLCDGMRGHGYSSEEFAEIFDLEEQEEYFTRGGRFDQICPTCKGKNVVPVVNENLLTEEQKKLFALYEEYADRQAQYDAEDRAIYRMENGYRD